MLLLEEYIDQILAFIFKKIVLKTVRKVVIDGWYQGAQNSEICTIYTGSSIEFWDSHQEECFNLIQRKIQTVAICFIFVATIVFTLYICIILVPMMYIVSKIKINKRDMDELMFFRHRDLMKVYLPADKSEVVVKTESHLTKHVVG